MKNLRRPETDDDSFLLRYQQSELKIAKEFFTTWLPFLSRDLCQGCIRNLTDRIHSLDPEPDGTPEAVSSLENAVSSLSITRNPASKDAFTSCENNLDVNCTLSRKDGHTHFLGRCKEGEDADTGSLKGWELEEGISEIVPESPKNRFVAESKSNERMSWADMAQEDEFDEENENSESKGFGRPKLTREQREYIRFTNVQRKKDFICFERVKGKLVNIVEGLELHTAVFSAAEQKRIVDFVYSLQEMGQRGEFKERTFTAPRKWMKGKGRVTIQFGCCYNYAKDKNGNPPGILQNEMVDPIPHLLKVIIRRLVSWHVLPPSCVPDSCIINIYDEGDCIPPHIDNHDFLRPFCTVSFLSECSILFGSELKILGPGEFSGSFSIPLPVGSVLVLNGNGADVAKHCVPAVPTKRISITFRKMDESKQPIEFTPEPDLIGIQPLSYEVDNSKAHNSSISNDMYKRQPLRREANPENGGSYDMYKRQPLRREANPENGGSYEKNYSNPENGGSYERNYSNPQNRGSYERNYSNPQNRRSYERNYSQSEPRYFNRGRRGSGNRGRGSKLGFSDN